MEIGHNLPLVTTIVSGLVFAFIFGTIAQRFRMPPLIGYLIAGILIGPYTPGISADVGLSQELAELGIILLMFGVGLHFSLNDLLSVRKISVPGAIGQITIATLLGMCFSFFLDWSFGAGLVFGLALSCASTVVLMGALDRLHLTDTQQGRIAIGWLIVEDIVMVFVLVMIPTLAPLLLQSSPGSTGMSEFIELILITAGKIALFIAIMLYFGKKLFPWLISRIAFMGNKELFRLCVLAIALGCAMVASFVFGVSFALGAFFAGVILNESELSHRAAEETSSLRDIFSVLFFVSVGMLFNPAILIQEPLLILATLFIIIIGKSAAAFLIVRLLGYPKIAALTIAISLAQIGEFSFILGTMGLGLKLLPPLGNDLILAGAIISILLNPLLFSLLVKYSEKLKQREEENATQTDEPELITKPLAIVLRNDEIEVITTMSNHTVMIGYGEVGKRILPSLLAHHKEVLIQESRLEIANPLRVEGIPVVYGHVLSDGALEALFIDKAESLIITVGDLFEVHSVIVAAKKINPQLNVIAKARDEHEYQYLKEAGADHVAYVYDAVAEKITDFLDEAESQVIETLEIKSNKAGQETVDEIIEIIGNNHSDEPVEKVATETAEVITNDQVENNHSEKLVEELPDETAEIVASDQVKVVADSTVDPTTIKPTTKE